MNLGKKNLALELLVRLQENRPTKYLMRKTCCRSPRVV